MSEKPQATTFENELAQVRARTLDKLSSRCAWGKFASQCTGNELKARANWNTIMQRQQAYEKRYC